MPIYTTAKCKSPGGVIQRDIAVRSGENLIIGMWIGRRWAVHGDPSLQNGPDLISGKPNIDGLRLAVVGD